MIKSPWSPSSLSRKPRIKPAREQALALLNGVVQALQERHRAAGDAWQQASRALAEREARAKALAALQAKIGSGRDTAAWLSARGLDQAQRLWQQLDIDAGWENALEAVLRERPERDAIIDPRRRACLDRSGDALARSHRRLCAGGECRGRRRAGR